MDTINELLTRGVDSIYPSKEELEKVLRTGKKLKLYQGFDPTGTQLHIGHMVGLRKLRQWQDLGHHVIFLIGDGTGQAGDPSGKKTARDKFFNREELRQNAVDYVKQASKIVRFTGANPIEILFNGDWLNELKLVDILEIAKHFSLQQMAERDMFQERIKKGEPVNLREFLYPLLQGYDSVAMQVDLELGGSDQTFNMLCGRTLVKAYLNKEKFVMTTPLLADSKGVKIGKTEGNAIALNDTPSDLYAKIMAFPDEVVLKAFEYLTDISMDQIQEMGKTIDSGENPLAYKKKLAFEIVKQLNSEKDAQVAEESFKKIVQEKEVPIVEVPVSFHSLASVSQILVDTQLSMSKSEAGRLISQKGVRVNGEVVEDPLLKVADGDEIQVGKFKKIKIKTTH